MVKQNARTYFKLQNNPHDEKTETNRKNDNRHENMELQLWKLSFWRTPPEEEKIPKTTVAF